MVKQNCKRSVAVYIIYAEQSYQTISAFLFLIFGFSGQRKANIGHCVDKNFCFFIVVVLYFSVARREVHCGVCFRIWVPAPFAQDATATKHHSHVGYSG